MANNYSQHAANQVLIGSKKVYDELLALLEKEEGKIGGEDRDDICNGFSLGFYPIAGNPNSGEIYLFAEESGNEGDLSDEFLKAFGKLIEANKLPYLEIGFSCTCDKMRVGEFGGGSYRITNKGKMIFPKITWPKR
jgi:hypothetical protein